MIPKIHHPEITGNTLIADIRSQSYWLFFIALVGILACVTAFSIGAAALILGKTSTGVFVSLTGSLSTLPFVGMVKTAHNWLKIANKELQNQSNKSLTK